MATPGVDADELPLPVTPIRFWAALWLLIFGTWPHSPVRTGSGARCLVVRRLRLRPRPRVAVQVAVTSVCRLGPARGAVAGRRIAGVDRRVRAGGGRRCRRAGRRCARRRAGSPAGSDAARASPPSVAWPASWLLGLWSDAIVMCIDLPSRSGVRSGTPWSLTRSDELRERFRPSSGWVSSRRGSGRSP
jgi:hypothetical protein